MRVVVAASSRYPYGQANAVNVFRMTAAFARSGADVRLVAFRSSLTPKRRAWQDTCRRYGEAPAVGTTLLWWPLARGAEPYLAACMFFLLLGWDRRTVIFTRVRYVVAIASLLGFRTVYESHALPLDRWRMGLESWLTRRKDTAFVVISKGLQNRYAKAGFPADAFVVARDAGRLLRDQAPRKDEFSGPCRDIGYIGSLYPGRGFEIIHALAGRLPELRFHVIGALDTLANLPDEWPNNLMLYDAVTPDQAERLAQLFDVLLMPYQNEVRIQTGVDTSGWMSPMKMFEYMLSGRPVISSDLPALREVLRYRVTALLVATDDVDAWVEALHELDAPERRFELAAAAFAEASERHTWDARLQHILRSVNLSATS